jgi:hypothetical protein
MRQNLLPVQTSRHILHQQIINLCHSSDLPLYFNKTGPKQFTNYQRVGLIVLFLRSKKSLRDFTQELCETRWTSWLDLRKLPKKSTLHDWLKLFGLKFIRSIISVISQREKPSLMAIDATGIDSWKRSRH